MLSLGRPIETAKFPSDGQLRTSRVFHAAFGAKMKVIKHDWYMYFELDIRRCSWLRNLYLGLRIHV